MWFPGLRGASQLKIVQTHMRCTFNFDNRHGGISLHQTAVAGESGAIGGNANRLGQQVLAVRNVNHGARIRIQGVLDRIVVRCRRLAAHQQRMGLNDGQHRQVKQDLFTELSRRTDPHSRNHDLELLDGGVIRWQLSSCSLSPLEKGE